MTEHPLLLNRKMVGATLAGLKCQTRRPMRPQPTEGWKPVLRDGTWVLSVTVPVPASIPLSCPFGVPGSKLWVRENFYQLKQGEIGQEWHWVHKPGCVKYGDEWCKLDRPGEFGYCKRPSIHMPRWASRITLTVKDVRVERVQDISEDDAEAEGIVLDHFNSMHSILTHTPYRNCFQYLWDFHCYRRGPQWETNPWVWVAEWDPEEMEVAQ